MIHYARWTMALSIGTPTFPTPLPRSLPTTLQTSVTVIIFHRHVKRRKTRFYRNHISRRIWLPVVIILRHYDWDNWRNRASMGSMRDTEGDFRKYFGVKEEISQTSRHSIKRRRKFIARTARGSKKIVSLYTNGMYRRVSTDFYS